MTDILDVVNELICRIEDDSSTATDETQLTCAPTVDALFEMVGHKRPRSDSIDSMETNGPTPKRYHLNV